MGTLGGETEEHVLPPGTMLEDKYRLESLLGAGGMGAVYRAVHTRLDKRVAIKLLQPALVERGDMVGRMLQEARAAGSLGHPNIVAVTDLGEYQGAPFIVMEYLDGEALSRRLKRGVLRLEEAVPLIVQVLDALSVVHAKGIVHRDLKPDNLMIVEGSEGRPTVKILDFGISKLVGAEAPDQVHTVTGTVMGTPSYMSPEQALGLSDVDGRSDLHAIGSVFYAMLFGKPPYRGPNSTATLARIMDGSYAPLSSVVPELPEAVDAVMERALARERDARFPDAATMREAVQALLRRERPAAPKHRAAGLVQPTVTPMQGATEVALDAHRSGSWSDSGVSGRSARMRVDAVAAAPKPREPSRLELDVPQGWKPGGVEASKVPSPVGTGRTAWGWYALMIALVVAGMGTWFFARKIDEGFDKIEESIDGVEVGDDAAPGETVLILVRPTPKDATVYVDGVQHDERTIEVPKSDESIEIRAQAPGYKPYTIQLTPQRTRQLELKMEKL